MKLKTRILEKTILKAIKTFPAIVVTGPRQSGKTTLFKMLFSKTHTLVSLEDPDIRIRAKEDPLSFLNQYRPPLYYLRSRDGLEVDLVIEIGGFLHLFEIKSSMTITSKHVTSLNKLANDLGSKVKTVAVISCSDDNFMIKENIANYNWKNILTV